MPNLLVQAFKACFARTDAKKTSTRSLKNSTDASARLSNYGTYQRYLKLFPIPPCYISEILLRMLPCSNGASFLSESFWKQGVDASLIIFPQVFLVHEKKIFPQVSPITMLIDYVYSFRTQDKRSSGMFWKKGEASSDSYENLQI